MSGTVSTSSASNVVTASSSPLHSSSITTTSSSSSTQPSWYTALSPGTKDWMCGIAGGLGKAVVGYPFDTIKGRVQTGKFPTVGSAIYGTVVKESPWALYQGFTMPTFNVCFISGVLFYTNGAIKNWIQPCSWEPLTYTQMFQAGGGGGLVIGVMITPLEVLKLRMQIRNKIEEQLITSPSASSSSQQRRVGLLRSVMSTMKVRDLGAGFTPTVLREAGTFGIFFPLNELLKRKISLYKDGLDLQGAIDQKAHIDRIRAASSSPSSSGTGDTTAQLSPPSPSLPDVPFSTRVLAAGTGGVLCWLPMYPVDQIKSRMQTKPLGTYTSWLHCAREIYYEQGIRRGFFKGLEPCLLRAFPAYAAQFLIFERMMGIMMTTT